MKNTKKATGVDRELTIDIGHIKEVAQKPPIDGLKQTIKSKETFYEAIRFSVPVKVLEKYKALHQKILFQTKDYETWGHEHSFFHHAIDDLIKTKTDVPPTYLTHLKHSEKRRKEKESKIPTKSFGFGLTTKIFSRSI
ncbi:MAG: hypothetical protein OXC61_06035 [Flavobacteriaceae bacterium]|nr:hypothetical protein [Flavobacteriaceae bacterium]